MHFYSYFVRSFVVRVSLALAIFFIFFMFLIVSVIEGIYTVVVVDGRNKRAQLMVCLDFFCSRILYVFVPFFNSCYACAQCFQSGCIGVFYFFLLFDAHAWTVACFIGNVIFFILRFDYYCCGITSVSRSRCF